MLLTEGGISINSAGFNKTYLYKAFMKKPTTFELEMSLTTDQPLCPLLLLSLL